MYGPKDVQAIEVWLYILLCGIVWIFDNSVGEEIVGCIAFRRFVWCMLSIVVCAFVLLVSLVGFGLWFWLLLDIFFTMLKRIGIAIVTYITHVRNMCEMRKNICDQET